MAKSFTQKQKKYIVKRMPTKFIALYIEDIYFYLQDHKDDKTTKADFELLHDELKNRGYTFEVLDCPPHGKDFAFIRYDKKAHEPVTMKIPTPSELLAMPVPTDLPKHGYLTTK
jgi:hypothetical protein